MTGAVGGDVGAEPGPVGTGVGVAGVLDPIGRPVAPGADVEAADVEAADVDAADVEAADVDAPGAELAVGPDAGAEVTGAGLTRTGLLMVGMPATVDSGAETVPVPDGPVDVDPPVEVVPCPAQAVSTVTASTPIASCSIRFIALSLPSGHFEPTWPHCSDAIAHPQGCTRPPDVLQSARYRPHSAGRCGRSRARPGVSAKGTDVRSAGTWTQPFWPRYPGAADFAGRQLHTHDYRGPEAFDGSRVVVIGGGISAVQLLMEIAPHTAAHTWVTRRPPVFVEREFNSELGRSAVAMVTERVSRGLPPLSVVSVTGLPLTPTIAAARRSGVLVRRVIFDRIVPDGVTWADGRFVAADVLFWCTGFRAALHHLGPLHLRSPGGGIVMDGTAVAADRRVHLIGYGPSASTIGANRAGRLAVRDIRQLLQL